MPAVTIHLLEFMWRFEWRSTAVFLSTFCFF